MGASFENVHGRLASKHVLIPHYLSPAPKPLLMANILLLSTPEGTVLLKQSIKQTLLDQFLQDWNSSVHNSPKAFNYRIFKTDFKFEEYFNILDEQNSFLLCKFRTANHKLPIEKERWINIPRENR